MYTRRRSLTEPIRHQVRQQSGSGEAAEQEPHGDGRSGLGRVVLSPYLLRTPAGRPCRCGTLPYALAWLSWYGVSTLAGMSEPARDLPVGSPAVEQAVELARRGVITHLTVHGERVAAIVPESVLDALRAAEDAEDAAEADAAMDEPGESIPWEQVKADLDL